MKNIIRKKAIMEHGKSNKEIYKIKLKSGTRNPDSMPWNSFGNHFRHNINLNCLKGVHIQKSEYYTNEAPKPVPHKKYSYFTSSHASIAYQTEKPIIHDYSVIQPFHYKDKNKKVAKIVWKKFKILTNQTISPKPLFM